MSETTKPSSAHQPGTSLIPAPHTSHPHAAGLWSALLASVVFVVLLIIAMVGGWMLWHQSRQLQALDAGLQNLSQQVTQLQTNAAQKTQLNSALANTQQTLKTFGDRLDSMDAALTDLRRRSEEGRDAWIRAEAASLLEAGNEEVQINSNPALALKALAAADARLKLLSDPRLIPVRQQIAKEETALRGVPQADVEGMALNLSTLAGDVDNLPLRRVAPEHYEPGDNHAVVNARLTLWQRIKASVSHLFAALFTVRHRAGNVEPLLAPNQEFFLRRNLELRLTAARAALLNRDAGAFRDSVRTAHDWLATYFNVQDPGVKSALQELAQMQAQDINPPLPDISRSLTLLRKLEGAQGAAP